MITFESSHVYCAKQIMTQGFTPQSFTAHPIRSSWMIDCPRIGVLNNVFLRTCFVVVVVVAAELLGIPTPPAYLNLTDQSTANGVNFATAGSGVTFANGENPLGGQVDNLELFLRTDTYSKKALANSVTLVSVNGNDYTAFNGNTSTASTVCCNIHIRSTSAEKQLQH
jgi:hypothetical protein